MILCFFPHPIYFALFQQKKKRRIPQNSNDHDFPCFSRKYWILVVDKVFIGILWVLSWVHFTTGIRKVIPQARSPVRAAGYKARGDENFYVLIDALDVNERDQRSLKSLFALREWQYNTVKVRSTSRLLLFWITTFRCHKAPKIFMDWLIILIKENEIIFPKVCLYLFLLLFWSGWFVSERRLFPFS